MGSNEWANIIAAFGPVGGLVAMVLWVLARSNFLHRDDPSRVDVLTKLDKMDDKLDAVRDRLTGVEVSQRELARRVDKLDR